MGTLRPLLLATELWHDFKGWESMLRCVESLAALAEKLSVSLRHLSFHLAILKSHDSEQDLTDSTSRQRREKSPSPRQRTMATEGC